MVPFKEHLSLVRVSKPRNCRVTVPGELIGATPALCQLLFPILITGTAFATSPLR